MNDDFNNERNTIIDNNHHTININNNLYLFNQNSRPGNKNNIYNDIERIKNCTLISPNNKNNYSVDDEINRTQNDEEKKEMITLKQTIIILLNEHQNIKSKYTQQCNINENEIVNRIQNIDDIEQLDNLLKYVKFSIELENENIY